MSVTGDREGGEGGGGRRTKSRTACGKRVWTTRSGEDGGALQGAESDVGGAHQEGECRCGAGAVPVSTSKGREPKLKTASTAAVAVGSRPRRRSRGRRSARQSAHRWPRQVREERPGAEQVVTGIKGQGVACSSPSNWAQDGQCRERGSPITGRRDSRSRAREAGAREARHSHAVQEAREGDRSRTRPRKPPPTRPAGC